MPIQGAVPPELLNSRTPFFFLPRNSPSSAPPSAIIDRKPALRTQLPWLAARTENTHSRLRRIWVQKQYKYRGLPPVPREQSLVLHPGWHRSSTSPFPDYRGLFPPRTWHHLP